MIIANLQKVSLLDYPDHISAIVFTQGCNFRCRFCYNPMLVWPKFTEMNKRAGEVKYEQAEKGQRGRPETNSNNFELAEGDLFEFLKSRKGKLDAVVITGGEPTLHKDLPDFIGKIKKLGFKVKLDTNGTNPEMIKDILAKKLVDYIAMDFKASPEKYSSTTGVKIDFKKINKSAKIIIDSKIDYEFRTTVVPGIFDFDDIHKIGKIIKGADKWFLQKFKSDVDLVDNDFRGKSAFSDIDMEEMVKIAKKYTKIANFR